MRIALPGPTRHFGSIPFSVLSGVRAAVAATPRDLSKRAALGEHKKHWRSETAGIGLLLLTKLVRQPLRKLFEHKSSSREESGEVEMDRARRGERDARSNAADTST
eukprot:5064293-Pleurochrysis_carterae.AAC.3